MNSINHRRMIILKQNEKSYFSQILPLESKPCWLNAICLVTVQRNKPCDTTSSVKFQINAFKSNHFSLFKYFSEQFEWFLQI